MTSRKDFQLLLPFKERNRNKGIERRKEPPNPKTKYVRTTDHCKRIIGQYTTV